MTLGKRKMTHVKFILSLDVKIEIFKYNLGTQVKTGEVTLSLEFDMLPPYD